MSFQPDPNMHWTEPFVRHVFAVIRGTVAPGFCTEALEEVRKTVDDLRLLTEWAEEKLEISTNPSLKVPAGAVSRRVTGSPRVYSINRMCKALLWKSLQAWRWSSFLTGLHGPGSSNQVAMPIPRWTPNLRKDSCSSRSTA